MKPDGVMLNALYGIYLRSQKIIDNDALAAIMATLDEKQKKWVVDVVPSFFEGKARKSLSKLLGDLCDAKINIR